MKKYKIKNTFNTSYKSSGYEDEELYEKEFDTLEDLEDLEELKNLLRDVDEDNFGNPFVNDRKEVNNEKIKNKINAPKEINNEEILKEFNKQLAALKANYEVEVKNLQNNTSSLRNKHNQEIEAYFQQLEKKEQELLEMQKELSKINETIKLIEAEKAKKEEFMKNEMNQYIELFNDTLFDEAFLLLDQNVRAMDDIIAKNKHIRDFFAVIFDIEFFNELLESDRMLAFSQSFVGNIMTKNSLQEMGKKLNNFVNAEKTSIMFSYLLQNNEFEKSKFLTQFFQPNLEKFPKTLEQIVTEGNHDAINFICENMKNIHFNEGALLRVCSDMSTKTLKMLIEEYHFDINEQSKQTGDNLVTALIKDKNVKNFKFVVDNYGDQINWNLSISKKGNNQSYFDIIDRSEVSLEYYDILLNDLTLKSSQVTRIAQSIFSTTDTLVNANQTNILDKLFSHPNFDNKLFNLGQHYLLYGLLVKIEVNAASNPRATTEYIKALDSYLDNHSEDTVPESTEFHIVGAALHIALLADKKMNDKIIGEKVCKEIFDATTSVLHRFPQYINKPNPNGLLPIMQVEKDSILYRLLVNEGAVPLEEETGFWNSLMRFGRKKPMVNEALLAQAQREANTRNNNQNQPATQLGSLREQMREDFREMRGLIANPLCAPSIKFKCENMFLNADKLAMMMEKHKVSNAFEELHFLSENFSNYLKKSLTYYITLCEATDDLASEDKKNSKLENAKNQCEQQVDLLKEQLQLISDNVFADVEQMAATNLRVQGRYLKERLEGTSKNISYDERLAQTVVNEETGEAIYHESVKLEGVTAGQSKEEKVAVNIADSFKKVGGNSLSMQQHEEETNDSRQIDLFADIEQVKSERESKVSNSTSVETEQSEDQLEMNGDTPISKPRIKI